MKLIKCYRHSSATAHLEKTASCSLESLKQIRFSGLMQIFHERIKKCWLASFILLFACIASFGKIKNGYETNISATKASLAYLQNLLLEKKDLSSLQRHKVEHVLQTLINHVSYYELTENLLTQFKIIAPDMFSEIDAITDRLGRSVDVYVKFVPRDATEVKAFGMTYASQLENDKDAYVSEYGPFTVSVKIWTVNSALLVLSHELGHVRYQVPNLASYVEFHRRYYKDTRLSTFIGHNPKDPSGKSADTFARTFSKTYMNFVRTRNERMQSPMVLLARIRKSLSNKYYAFVKTSRPTVTL